MFTRMYGQLHRFNMFIIYKRVKMIDKLSNI